MKVIEYRVVYSGELGPRQVIVGNPDNEIITVTARDINSGFAKALKRANERLGNGRRREIASVEFWAVR